MQERPILFSAPMVRALLNGTKTQTRRVMKTQPEPLDPNKPDGYYHCDFRGGNVRSRKANGFPAFIEHCPYGQLCDRLWVRETWMPRAAGSAALYRADYDDAQASGLAGMYSDRGWRPSIHMPRWASRILLEIVSVRVERLQEITNDDARAEGPEYAHPHRHGTEGLEWEPHPGEIVRDSYAARHNTGWNDCWICAYRQIWESINGPGSWDANPWVWVIEFKRVTS